MSAAIIMVLMLSSLIAGIALAIFAYFFLSPSEPLGNNEYRDKDGKIIPIDLSSTLDTKTYSDVVEFKINLNTTLPGVQPINGNLGHPYYYINYGETTKWEFVDNKDHIITYTNDTPFTLKIRQYSKIFGNNGTVSCQHFCSNIGHGKPKLPSNWTGADCADDYPDNPVDCDTVAATTAGGAASLGAGGGCFCKHSSTAFS